MSDYALTLTNTSDEDGRDITVTNSLGERHPVTLAPGESMTVVASKDVLDLMSLRLAAVNDKPPTAMSIPRVKTKVGESFREVRDDVPVVPRVQVIWMEEG